MYKEAYKNKLLGLRNRALILCLWQSDVRVNSICTWKFGLVKKYLYPQPDPPVPIYYCIYGRTGPGVYAYDTKLTAYGLGYYVSFVGVEASEALKAWLDERTRALGPMRDDDYIFIRLSRETQKLDPNNPMGLHDVLHVVKTLARRSGLDPKGIWSHTLRKGFKKVLNRAPIADDFKEALMGHRLPGSRVNYFDVHDVEELRRMYAKADFSRVAISRLNHLEARVRELEAENLKLRQQLEALPQQIFDYYFDKISPQITKVVLQTLVDKKVVTGKARRGLEKMLKELG